MAEKSKYVASTSDSRPPRAAKVASEQRTSIELPNGFVGTTWSPSKKSGSKRKPKKQNPAKPK